MADGIHMPSPRSCEECGAPLTRNPKEKTQAWLRRRFCNHSCARRFGPRRPLQDRFAAKVRIEGNCHIWTGAKNKDGYGQLRVDGKTVLAHRQAYLMAQGELADDRQVLHRCDTPACVNPAHLFLGDHAMNMGDMSAKGRGRSAEGAAHHAAKLDADKVRAILADTRMQKDIAADYGVSGAVISSIKLRKTWKHVQ